MIFFIPITVHPAQVFTRMYHCVSSPAEPFDVKTCRSKLAEHYKRTATVHTSVWSKTSPVDIHQIYTRLSWVKEEQTPDGSSQSKLKHYTDLFTANKNGVVPKRILVQGQTGIGKSTFVKKLAVDWAELDDKKTEDKQEKALKVFEGDGDANENEEEVSHNDKITSSEVNEDRSSNEYKDITSDEVSTSDDEYEDTSSNDEYEDTSNDDEYEDMSEYQKKALKKFKLVVVINLKEVSNCPSFKEVLCFCNILPDEETTMVEGLLSYITNQENVLLVFDGYDEYRCGSNSEVYDIFSGNKLSNCFVLITTRISKADELGEFKDMHAEITGFSKKDRKAFMRRMLGGEAETKALRRHLSQKNLTDLTRVPLLLLFFCTLWRREKLKSFPETKTKLYLKIVQYILDYNQGKHRPARFDKVEDFKEVLSEIGKVALECLLKDDHVFEYNQLSAAILGDESRIIGLLQVSEYAENLRPAGMVSFIHKSIQEFLAAWYITYRCVPEGNLGEIEQHARTLEDCKALENVFQFICGLSDDGAVKVFQHLTSVRISDPTLDLSKTIPDVENETDVPLCDVTYRHDRFSDLVYDFFREVRSKTELLSHCFDCTGGIFLVDRLSSELMPKANALTELTHCVFRLSSYAISFRYEILKFLNCLQMPLTIPESSKVLTVGDFLRELQNMPACCFFMSILCFRNGQCQFFITDLVLCRDEHVRLFMQSTSSIAASSCSEQSCLKFLSSLCCYELSSQTVKALGAVIQNCKHLNRIQVQNGDDSVCDLLEQVPNPSKCSLVIGHSSLHPNVHLTSAGAAQLARLLPRFNNIVTLYLGLSDCCSAAVDTLVTSLTHKTLERLGLNGIRLTLAAAVALGRSLPEMSSLQELVLTGVDESILQPEGMEALFGGFNKTLPLSELTFRGFRVRGLATLPKSLRFFPNLRELNLEHLKLNEHDQCSLLESFGFIAKNVRELSIQCKPLDNSDCRTAEVNTVGKRSLFADFINKLEVNGITLSPAVVAVLGWLLPGIPSLNTFKLTGMDGRILQTREMEVLFGGFNKTLPLSKLTFSGFSFRGCLAPLTKSFRFFPNLRELNLGVVNEELHMDEQNLCGLLESLTFIPNLKTLSVKGKLPGQAHCCTGEVNPKASVTHKTLTQLHLDGISLTPVVSVVLGRLLPEMSSLQELVLTGLDGSILQAEEMEALFGGFSKTLPLYKLTFSGFGVGGCLASLTKSFRFFPNLREMNLGGFNGEFSMDEQNVCHLLENLRFIPNLKKMYVKGKLLRQAHCCTAEVNPKASVTHKTLKQLHLDGISLTPAVAALLGRSLPEMPSLQVLKFTGVDGSVLKAKEMEALFAGFNKTLPLTMLTFGGFSVRGCLAPLTKSLQFFPSLTYLNLRKLNMDEHDLCGLLESFQFIPDLWKLNLSGNPLGHAVRSIVPHVSKLLKLQELWINQTGHSEEDLNYVRDTLQQTLPEHDIYKYTNDSPPFYVIRFSCRYH